MTGQLTPVDQQYSQLEDKKFLTMLDRRAFKAGGIVYTDDPAYTSVIGKVNFMGRYGITPHEAAAIVITRRIQRYSEVPIKEACMLPMHGSKDKKVSNRAGTAQIQARIRGRWQYHGLPVRLRAGGYGDYLQCAGVCESLSSRLNRFLRLGGVVPATKSDYVPLCCSILLNFLQ